MAMLVSASITSPAINRPRNSSNFILSEPVLGHKVLTMPSLPMVENVAVSDKIKRVYDKI